MDNHEPPPHDAISQEDTRKTKARLRVAWVSFASRIVAQLVGATATVVFAIVFLGKHQPSLPAATAGEPERSQTAVQIANPGRDRQGLDHRSVAVLPLENLSTDQKADRLADAMTDALVSALSRLEGLQVISRTSSMHYKGVRKPLPDIARELKVDWVVEGSVLIAGDRVRVVGQLIDGASDEHVWTATYDRPYRDVLALQAAVASAIAADVRAAIVQGPRRPFAEPVAATSGKVEGVR